MDTCRGVTTPTHLQLFQGDTLLHDNPWSADAQWIEVPPGNQPFRAVLDAERPGEVFRLSTRTHTEWTFMSDTVDGDNFKPFSVLQLDYRLETDLRGDIGANRPQSIALRPRSSDSRHRSRHGQHRDASTSPTTTARRGGASP